MRKFDYTNYINWINEQDVFWVRDMLVAFDIKRTGRKGMAENAVGLILRTSKALGYIIPSGIEKSNTQYMTIKKIPLDIKLR